MADPVFVDTDFQTILAEYVSTFETLAGQTIPPASLTAVLIRLCAYREKLLRILINETGKLNFLAFARDSALDYIGDLVGVDRLTDQAAVCEIEFEWAAPLAVDLVIPAGTRIQSSDGLLIFAIDEDQTVSGGSGIGATTFSCNATCTTSGESGNDYAAGSINTLLDSLAVAPASVGNLAATEGGADSESDDHYRSRIYLASESAHGTVAHYKKLALSASTEIADVSVQNINPGIVGIYAICRDGDLPSAPILALIEAAVDTEEEKTLCDTVIVAAATPVAFAVDVDVFFDENSSSLSASTLDEAERVITEWADSLKISMGKDIIPEEITQLVQGLPGVYRCVVNTPIYTLISKSQVAQYSAIAVSSGGEVEA